MTEEQISMLIHSHRTDEPVNDENLIVMKNSLKRQKQTKKSNKRKRRSLSISTDQGMLQSLSQLSISQPTPKRKKNRPMLHIAKQSIDWNETKR